MKLTRSTGPSIRLITMVACSLLATITATDATPLFWDGNGATTGAGSAPTGTWGTDGFWNTDSLGNAGTFGAVTTGADDLSFSAGPDAASGNGAYTVTVSGTRAANSLTFQSSGTTLITGGSINLGGGGILARQFAYGSTARNTVTIASGIALQADQAFTNQGTAGLVLSGSISGSSNLSLQGAITLSGTNSSYSGTTTLNSGTLNINNAAALGSGTFIINGGTINNSTGASITLSTNNAQTWNGDFSFTATQALNMGTGNVSMTGNRAISVSGATTSLSVPGIISDGGNAYTITKNGGGRLDLGGSNTYSGGLILNNGQIRFGGTGGGPGTGTLTINGGTIVTAGTTLVNNNAQTWAGNFSVIGGSGTQNMGTGTVTLTGDRSVNVGSGQVFTVGGSITESGGTFGLTKNGIGQMTLTGASNYGGDTVVGAGTLQISGANDRLPTTTNLVVSGGASAGGTFNLNGRDQSVGGLSGGSGTVKGIVQNGAASTTSTLTVTGSSTFDGIIRNNGGTLALTKSVGGTLVLTGANTYTGATTISAGSLIVNGSLASGSAVALNGGTLGGSGTIGGLVTTAGAGAILSPGNSPGTLTLSGGLDATSGSTFIFELGTSSDLLSLGSGVFTGSASAGGLAFQFLDAGGLAAATPYTLLTFGSTSGLDYSDLFASSLPAGYVLDTGFGTNGFNITGSSLQVQFTAVPEPSACLLLATGLCIFVGIRRRTAV